MFESSEIEAKKVFDARDTSAPLTPGQTAMKNLFTIEAEKMNETVRITTPVKALFATPARETRFSDFCDSAFKKDETKPKLEGLVSPGPAAMKHTFHQDSPMVESDPSKNCFASPNTSVINFEDAADMKQVEEIFEDVCSENYSLAQLFAEKRASRQIERYANNRTN